MPRQHKLTQRLADEFCEYIRQYGNAALASRQCGIAKSTGSRWQGEYPWFGEQVRLAYEEYLKSQNQEPCPGFEQCPYRKLKVYPSPQCWKYTRENVEKFIEVLIETGNIAKAQKTIGISSTTYYKWLDRPNFKSLVRCGLCQYSMNQRW